MAEEELNSYEADWQSASTIKSGIKKHTLDSDEEDEGEEKKYEIMEDDDIEGQEDGTGGFDGEVTITPFNMKEEMEEGHFDTEGNYHWKKEGKVIKDNWLENIDWVEIKKQENPPAEAPSSDSEDSSPFDQIPFYRKMLAFMKPGESVTKTLRRLGGSRSMSASERWRQRKAGLLDTNTADRQQVVDLTELANTLLTETGNMDVYEETFEHISALVEASESKRAASRPTPKSYDDALDMYADDFDEKEKARLSDKTQPIAGESSKNGDAANVANQSGAVKHKLSSEGSETPCKKPKVRFADEAEVCGAEGNDAASGADSASEEEATEGGVQWELQRTKDATEVEGPLSTAQMVRWARKGCFRPTPVWVRRIGQDGPFYSSDRVDFELYLD